MVGFELDLELDFEVDSEVDSEVDLEVGLGVGLEVGLGVGFALEDDDLDFGVTVGRVKSPSSPSSSSGLSRGQELAVVVVAVGLILQPLDVAELVVLQLAELVDPEVTVVQETK